MSLSRIKVCIARLTAVGVVGKSPKVVGGLAAL